MVGGPARGGGGPLGFTYINYILGPGDKQNHRFICLGGGKGVERGEIPIFDFLECWGYEGPIRTFGMMVHESPIRIFGMVGVLSTPFDFYPGWSSYEVFGIIC